MKRFFQQRMELFNEKQQQKTAHHQVFDNGLFAVIPYEFPRIITR